MMYRYFCILLMALPGLAQSFDVDAVTIDLDEAMPNPLLYVVWGNGKSNCILFPTETGVKFNTPPAKPGETLQQYVDRSWSYMAFNQKLQARCDAMAMKYVTSWTVAPLNRKGRVYDRPVYAYDVFPGIKAKIGTAPAGTPCGAFVKAYSKRIKALAWRRISIPAGDGVTVCKR